jgi:hypothetical protein
MPIRQARSGKLDLRALDLEGEARMGKLMSMVMGATLLVGAVAGVAEAACTYEGSRYPAGTVLCIGGKIYVCESNDAWKVDRTSSCSN